MDYRCPHCGGVAKEVGDLIICQGDSQCEYIGFPNEFESVEDINLCEYKPDKFYWHEALDRSSLACDFFHDNVACHPAIENDDELRVVSEKITSQIADFYQLVGRKADEFNKE